VSLFSGIIKGLKKISLKKIITTTKANLRDAVKVAKNVVSLGGDAQAAVAGAQAGVETNQASTAAAESMSGVGKAVGPYVPLLLIGGAVLLVFLLMRKR
jgi:phage-related minor tail protein